MQKSFVYERKINYYETDKMGIVHHSNYIRFMEESRIAFLESNGMNYAEFERQGVVSPVVAVECRFKTPCTYGDNINIRVEIVEYKGVRFVYEYEMTNKETGEIVAIGKTEHCFTDETGKPIIIKKKFPELHETFSKILELEN